MLACLVVEEICENEKVCGTVMESGCARTGAQDAAVSGSG